MIVCYSLLIINCLNYGQDVNDTQSTYSYITNWVHLVYWKDKKQRWADTGETTRFTNWVYERTPFSSSPSHFSPLQPSNDQHPWTLLYIFHMFSVIIELSIFAIVHTHHLSEWISNKYFISKVCIYMLSIWKSIERVRFHLQSYRPLSSFDPTWTILQQHVRNWFTLIIIRWIV